MKSPNGQARHAVIEGLCLVGNPANGSIAGLRPEAYSACIDFLNGSCDIRAVEQKDPAIPGFLEAARIIGEPAEPTVATAYLHVTQRCNMRCTGCYSANARRNVLQDPSVAELGLALEFLGHLGTRRLVISGGEPFLRDDLERIVSSARENGIGTVDIVTNGSRLVGCVLRVLAGSVNTVAVSYSGDDLDGAGALGRTLSKERLADAIDAIRSEGITAQMLVTLHSGNASRVPDFLALGDQLGVRVIFSMFACPPNRPDLEYLALSEPQLKVLLEAVLKERSFKLDSEDDTYRLSFKDSCGIGRTSVSIDADGTVYPCHMMHDERFTIGNAFCDSLDQLLDCWHRNPFRELDVRRFNSCKLCEYHPICGGGCRARAFAHCGDFCGKDPQCALSLGYYRSLIDRVKRQYDLC